MQHKPRFDKHSFVIVIVFFLTSVAVLSAAGQPIASDPVAVTSCLISDEDAPYSSSAVLPENDLQAKTEGNSIPNGSSSAPTPSPVPVTTPAPTSTPTPAPTTPVPASTEKSEPKLSESDALALAGGSGNANKTMASAETPASYRYVNANELNVRSGAGTSFEKIASLKRKDKVGVFSISGEWARIQTSSGITGYTLTQYLVAKLSDVEPEQPVAYWYVNADTLNVRSGAGTGYEKVATLGRGDKVGYFDKSGEWARIQTSSGKTGYVLAKYMVDNKSSVEYNVSRGDTSSASSAATGEVTALAQQIADYSTNFQGVKYVYGGSSTKGFDCSGFVQYVYTHFGIYVPRSSYEYASFGVKVSRDNLRPSDILLFDTDGGSWDVTHVGIYLGNDKFIHASSSKGKVVIMSLSQYLGKLYGIRRVID